MSRPRVRYIGRGRRQSDPRMKAILVLENGAIFRGTSVGADGCAGGEVCFNTSMSGYQEILTDPSYCGQIIAMTAPMIGNTGTNPEDAESDRPWASGFVVRECSRIHSNYRARGSLQDYLSAHGIVAMEGVDTRELTRMLRSSGAMRGFITTEEMSDTEIRERVLDVPGISDSDLAAIVSAREQYDWSDPGEWNYGFVPREGRRFRVAVMDFGVKRNILRRLVRHGCDLTVYPSRATAEEILRNEPDGIFLSNGPGDPAAVIGAVDTIRELAARTPVFGICLGHQLLALSFGASSYKLIFGHRGANHPVRNLRSGAVEITAQNHGFAVNTESLPAELELTHMNLNDGTVEGFRHRELPVFCVQYHPEAGPGPHDGDYLFREFRDIMRLGTGG